MDVKHPNTKLCGLDRGFRHGIWDVVKLEIKKDLLAGLDQFPNKSRPGRRKKLQSDLKRPNLAL